MKKKPWYQLRGMMYSTSFKFFLENQINIWNTATDKRYTSRLESFTFRTIASQGREFMLNIDDLKEIRNIHRLLLEGHFGEGTLVD